MRLRSILITSALLLAATASAQGTKHGDLVIANPYARATVPGQPSGAAYLTIENKGIQGDKLVGAVSPIANSVQIHTMSMQGDVMKMREAGAIELQPSSKTEMKPGEGYHLMLIGLKQPLKAGDTFPVTLNFEKAGKVDVTVRVEDKGGMAQHGAAMHQSR